MLRDNLTRVLETIERAARKSGRSAREVDLVAVSKTVGLERIREAAHSGQILFGENYIKEAADKIPQLPDTLTWHFIGHLQSNKARQAVELFDVIETVDRLKVAKALDTYAQALNKQLAVLIQVNIGREPQKSGVLPEETEVLCRRLADETNFRPIGLMAMPPFAPDPEESRPYFKELRRLAQRLARLNLFADNADVALSMGMSNDYPIAIEEGATLVRVGTALFGER